MEELDSELIIDQVKRYPCIYDAKEDSYKDRELKKEVWLTITAATLGEKWLDLDDKEQLNACKDVRTRWKSMKDSYIKSLKNPEGKTPNCSRPRRPYMYHKQLAFLQDVSPTKESSETKYVNGNDGESEGESETNANDSEILDPPVLESAADTDVSKSETPESSRSKTSSKLRVVLRPNKRKSSIPKKAYVESTPVRSSTRIKKEPVQSNTKDVKLPALKIVPSRDSSAKHSHSQVPPVKRPASEPQDPDEMFFLSQVPVLKRIKPDDKLEFQIQFMQLLQTFSKRS